MKSHQRTNKLPEIKLLFLERMQKLLPDKKDFQSYLDILKIPPVRSIRCNKLKISPTELKSRLENKGWEINQPLKNYPEIMIVEGKGKGSFALTDKRGEAEPNRVGGLGKAKLINLEPGELGRALEHQLGYYYIQELSSMLPVIALAPNRDELILDLCAAPGSKTTQLSSEMNTTGTIIANEISIGRLKILASNLERCGAGNTIITRKDGIAFCERLKKYNPEITFDRILVDAPCSGEGTLRSSLKTYTMWNIKTIKNLPKIQRILVESALEILKPNGTLVYSTCTHAPEENEGVVDYILDKFKNQIKLEPVTLPIKTREGIVEWDNSSLPNKSCEYNKSASEASVTGLGGQDKLANKILKFSKEIKKCARVYPQDNNTEGFFIAKFRRLE